MKPIDCRKRKSVAAAAVILFTLLCLAGQSLGPVAGATGMIQQQGTHPGTGSAEEALPAVPEMVRLSWNNLPSPDAITFGSPSRVVLRVANISAAPMRVELFFTADNGGQQHERRSFPTMTLAPSEMKTAWVDLRSFGFMLANLKYSGQLEATARAVLANQTQYHQSDSTALYFHPTRDGDASSLTFYGKKALLERFNAGDFRGRLSRETIEQPGAVTTRVMFGGSGSPSGPASGDDPGEPAEPDDLEDAATSTPQASSPVPPKAAAAHGVNHYTTNIKFLIRTADSSARIPVGPNAGLTEDYYKGANEGISVIARGVHVTISLPDSGDADSEPDWMKQFVADPVTGSFNWSHTATSGFIIRVWGISTDAKNNYVRIHDDPDSFDGYVGKTYSRVLVDVDPTPGGSDTYEVGSYQSEWTAMAALAFGLYRYNSGLSDKAFHVGIDDARPDGSSAHFGSGQSNGDITNGRHYLKLGNGDVDADGDPATPQTKYKFIVTHEFGHAIAALYYGSHDDAVNGGEPSDEYDYSYTDDAENVCGTGGDFYSIDSKEWNWLGFREGFAHFIAAKIWNTKDTVGTFTWFGVPHDLNRYNFGASYNAGGRLENQCVCIVAGCNNDWEGATTIEDWLRFFWDWYTTTPNVCADQPSKTDMLRLYRQVRLNGGLTKGNYYDKMREAVDDLDGDVSDCLQTTSFDAYGDHNGINN